METQRTIVLLSGGFSDGENIDQDVFLLESSMRRKPRVCFIPTASGDSRAYIERFYTAFKRYSCIPAHLELFRRTELNLEEFIRRQDIIYIGGGNTANLLAVWRLHGLDRVLRKAYAEGAVLSGISAGAACWFESCLTDSFGRLMTVWAYCLSCSALISIPSLVVPEVFCRHYKAVLYRQE